MRSRRCLLARGTYKVWDAVAVLCESGSNVAVMVLPVWEGSEMRSLRRLQQPPQERSVAVWRGRECCVARTFCRCPGKRTSSA